VARAAQTEKEAEEDAMFFAAFDELKTFFIDKSNCTVLQHQELEADDLIAGWVQAHPQDHHTIISSDSDFHQLLAENVNQYNGVADELHTINGIYDGKGKPVIDKKTKEPKKIPDPAWILFEKIIRGDPTDNVFSAYPGARVKSSKNKIGLTEAFADRISKGYAWNNLMLQRWVDHNEVEHKVLDDYHRNKTLIDLTAQPNDIKAKIVECITANSITKNKPMIGAQLLKFCGKYDLKRIGDQAERFVEFLQAPYV
jgi:5'-3' exonuclease